MAVLIDVLRLASFALHPYSLVGAAAVVLGYAPRVDSWVNVGLEGYWVEAVYYDMEARGLLVRGNSGALYPTSKLKIDIVRAFSAAAALYAVAAVRAGPVSVSYRLADGGFQPEGFEAEAAPLLALPHTASLALTAAYRLGRGERGESKLGPFICQADNGRLVCRADYSVSEADKLLESILPRYW